MSNSPSELVAIARAAHEVGDAGLKRSAVRQLRDEFGICITFARNPEGTSSETKKREAAGV